MLGSTRRAVVPEGQDSVIRWIVLDNGVSAWSMVSVCWCDRWVGDRRGVCPETLAYDDEAYLQELLAGEPSRVLGVGPQAMAVRELSTSGGPIDVCIVDVDGSVTVVECKLASRSVQLTNQYRFHLIGLSPSPLDPGRRLEDQPAVRLPWTGVRLRTHSHVVDNPTRQRSPTTLRPPAGAQPW